MPSIPLQQKCLNIILIWVIVSHKLVVVVSKKVKKDVFFFFLLFLIGKNRRHMVLGKRCGYFRLGMGWKFGPYKSVLNTLSDYFWVIIWE